MATKNAAAKTAEKNAPTVEPDATVAEQPTEPEVVEYVPSDDDGLSSIDDFDVDETTEVDANDDGWGYDLPDDEVSSPEAIAAAELEVEEQAKAAAAAEGKSDD